MFIIEITKQGVCIDITFLQSVDIYICHVSHP